MTTRSRSRKFGAHPHQNSLKKKEQLPRSSYEMSAVLFERESGNWVAQCLQSDIGAQAGSLPDLLYELQKALVGHIVIATENGIEPFESLPSAPQEYWEKWKLASASIEAEAQPFRVPTGVQPAPHLTLKLAA